MRHRHRGDGTTIHLFDGITSESNIVHCSVQNPDILHNIEPQKYVIIKKYRVSMSTSSTDIYVTIQDGMIFQTSHFDYNMNIERMFLRAPLEAMQDALQKPAGTRLSIKGRVEEVSPKKETTRWSRTDILMRDEGIEVACIHARRTHRKNNNNFPVKN